MPLSDWKRAAKNSWWTPTSAITRPPRPPPTKSLPITSWSRTVTATTSATRSPFAKRISATVIANAEISRWLGKQGVEAHGQHIGGGYQYPFGYLKLTLALHGSSLPDGSDGGNPCGFFLTTIEGKKVYVAGDTGLFGDMKLIGDEGLDLAVIPIGDNYTMGPDDALRAVKLLTPRHVIPYHYGTWDLIAQDPNLWAARVAKETKAQVHVLKPGDSFEL
jgi:L-ascorbate metabolism protein UlaG (beta-lactamase superfamily)